MDGRSGTGPQLLQLVEDDGEELQGWRYEQLLGVLTHIAAAAVLGSHRPGPPAVSVTQLSELSTSPYCFQHVT